MHLDVGIIDLEGTILSREHDERSAPSATDETDKELYCMHRAQNLLQKAG